MSQKKKQSKFFLKSKQIWIGLSQLAGGLAASFFVPAGGGIMWGVPQAMGGALAIIDRVFDEEKPIHFIPKKSKQEDPEVDQGSSSDTD